MSQNLASIAKKLIGYKQSNCFNQIPFLHPNQEKFFLETIYKWDNRWSSSFIDKCCKQCGVAFPKEQSKWCDHLDNWEPKEGDVVIFDDVMNGFLYERMGIVLEKSQSELFLAEGTYYNGMTIVKRPINNHIRAYVRFCS